MRYWGRGRYRHLTDRLRDPRARRYSQRLMRACGCGLAWHRKRGVYVVYRPRGSRAAPQTYLDLAPHRFPQIASVRNAIAWADARNAADFMRMLDMVQRQEKEWDERDRRDYIEDFLPDYYKDLKRFRELVTDGRYRPKHFDVWTPPQKQLVLAG